MNSKLSWAINDMFLRWKYNILCNKICLNKSSGGKWVPWICLIYLHLVLQVNLLLRSLMTLVIRYSQIFWYTCQYFENHMRLYNSTHVSKCSDWGYIVGYLPGHFLNIKAWGNTFSWKGQGKNLPDFNSFDMFVHFHPCLLLAYISIV